MGGTHVHEKNCYYQPAGYLPADGSFDHEHFLLVEG
jgi:hypothetical protein